MRRRQSRRRDVIEKSDDAADSSEKSDERVFHYKKGPCSKGACHEDPNVGCKVFENNTHACVCTHDSLPPTRKGDCPRKTVPIVAGRIPNVQPPLNSISLPTSNSTLASVQQPSATQSAHTSTLIYFSILPVGVIIFVVVVLLITRWKKRKQMIQEQQASPINLKHSLLIAERYAPNPQYSACPGAGVPILRKETLKFLNEIGEGCFGKVYKGEMTVEDGNKTETVAIKVLKKSASSEAEENFLREVEIMSTFKHQYILSLLGVVLRTDAATAPMMVFEYMPHGDLAEVLRSQRSPGGAPKTGIALQLPRKDLLSVALQVASGMRYLAAQRFVHRDLACRNCLVADGPTVKIADFGMSRDVYTCDYYKIGGSRLLPVRWMSPESVLYGRFTLESDIWSYGVVLWEIYSLGKQPYYGHTNEEVVKLILDGIMLIPPDDCPSLICELMKHCWKTEPRDRIKFPSICDKLELAYENALESGEDGNYVESTDVKSSQLLKYENEFKQKVANLNKSLPRPPPIHVFKEEEEEEEECDLQGYLIPKTIERVQYLETLPD